MKLTPYKLGEFCQMKYGKMPPKDILSEDGYPVYSGYRITGYAKDYLFDEPRVIVVARGVGGTGDVKISPEKSWITNLVIVLEHDPHIVDKRFLFYRLGLEPLKDKLNTGAAQAQITIDSLASYALALPNLVAQKQIASILSAYDDLIENNQRRMELLETSARQLYHEWFVRLRFPGYEHTNITNGVPERWERRSISEIASFLKRGITPRYDDDADGLVINQKCIRNGRVDFNLARRQSREYSPDRKVRLGDVLVNSTGEGTLGRVGQVLMVPDNCTVDSHVTIVRPIEEIGKHYFGLAVRAWEPRFSTMGRGATNQTELSPGQIGDANILLPPHALQAQFEEFAEPCFRQVAVLVEQNQKLRVARDLLLPRLMSGEIAV